MALTDKEKKFLQKIKDTWQSYSSEEVQELLWEFRRRQWIQQEEFVKEKENIESEKILESLPESEKIPQVSIPWVDLTKDEKKPLVAEKVISERDIKIKLINDNIKDEIFKMNIDNIANNLKQQMPEFKNVDNIALVAQSFPEQEIQWIIDKSKKLTEREWKWLLDIAVKWFREWLVAPFKAIKWTAEEIPWIIKKRWEEIKETAWAQAWWDIWIVQWTIRNVGDILWWFSDVAWSVIVNTLSKVTPQPLKEELKEKAIDLLNTDIWKKWLISINEWIDKYNEWKSKNKNEAELLEAFLNIAEVVPATKIAKWVVKWVGWTVSKVWDFFPWVSNLTKNIDVFINEVWLPNINLFTKTRFWIKWSEITREEATKLAQSLLKPWKYDELATDAFVKYARPASDLKTLKVNLEESLESLKKQFKGLFQSWWPTVKEDRISNVILEIFDKEAWQKFGKDFPDVVKKMKELETLFDKSVDKWLDLKELQDLKLLVDDVFRIYKNSWDVKAWQIAERIQSERKHLKELIEKMAWDEKVTKLNKDYQWLKEAIDLVDDKIRKVWNDEKPPLTLLNQIKWKVFMDYKDLSKLKRELEVKLPETLKKIFKWKNAKSIIDIITWK